MLSGDLHQNPRVRGYGPPGGLAHIGYGLACQHQDLHSIAGVPQFTGMQPNRNCYLTKVKQ